MLKNISAFVTGGIVMAFYAVPTSTINSWASSFGLPADAFVVAMIFAGFVTATFTMIGD